VIPNVGAASTSVGILNFEGVFYLRGTKRGDYNKY